MKYILYIALRVKAATRLIVCMILVIIAGTSCLREIEKIKITEPQEPVTDKEINFSIRLPSGPATPNSRAITEEEECYISSLYILSFRIGGNNETFDYWTQATEKEYNFNGSPIQYYSANLKVQNYPQRLVVLTNLSEETRNRIASGNWEGVDKNDMLQTLSEEVIGPDYKWNATGSWDYRSLPMWGESAPQTIIFTTNNLTEVIPLLRMVAGINVQLDEYSDVIYKFQLRSVRLYNTNRKGNIIPDPANIQEFTSNQIREVFASYPTIPADIADYSERYLGPVVYEDFSYPGQDDIAMCNAIYLFETASTTNYAEATCLVIGGYYDYDYQETYYRVDLLTEDGEITDILRNHKYTVTIRDVRQRGYSDPYEAFLSRGKDMDVSILHWNENGTDEIWFDGLYYYSITPRFFNIQGAGASLYQVKVKTDYPLWSYQLSDKPDPDDWMANPGNASWIEVTSHDPGEEYPGNGLSRILEFKVTNPGIRTGYIHVTAGQLTMTVTVRQTN